MTRERYNQWMAVWKWFQKQKSSDELGALCEMLNVLWREDRKSSTPEQLAGYSEAFHIEDDPQFKRFLQDLDQGFR